MKHVALVAGIFFAGLISAQHSNSNCQHAHKALNPQLMTAPENMRSDTADVLKYTVALNITDFTTNTITGNTKIQFTPKINGLNYLCLDLLEMTIDSIKDNSTLLTYTYDDTLLRVNLAAPLNITDTSELTVYYHGAPQLDPSGFGGWYWQNGYSYNLGVGFEANPHVYGRVWHPCFDNFAERAKYDFHITTNAGKTSFCSGVLLEDSLYANGDRVRYWSLTDEIPSYLANISVANYTSVNQTYSGMLGQIPVMLAAVPSDTTNLKNSFANLPDALQGFEYWYGPYVWQRIGFALVPFNGGAMEHATNISYPRAAVNGSLANENLMAHEFAHHWWGDHSTCETAGEMWLNEGFASYSEFLFYNWVYNYQTYLDKIKVNHEDMVHYAHHREGWLIMNNVPHEHVYGNHVYLKGADMVHTIRGYLGDSLFKIGMNYVQQMKGFQNINSIELGNLLSAATGVNMNQFVADWILQPGWPHFSIDSVQSVAAGGGNYTVTVYVKQKLKGAFSYYTNVPLEITFKDATWQNSVKKIFASGQTSSAIFTLPFDPVYTGINVESKISDAISSKYKIIKTTGTQSFSPANFTLNVQTPGDSSWIRVEHSFVVPDSIKNNISNYRLNTQHYWKVDGILSPGLHSKAIMYYDGRKSTNGVTQYLDTCLTTITVDSVILLYRRNAADDWKEVDKYTKTKLGGATGKHGFFTVDTLRLGEYATANGVSSVLLSENEIKTEESGFTVYPNPSDGNFTLKMFFGEKAPKNVHYEIFDLAGKLVLNGKLSGESAQIPAAKLPSGEYIFKLSSDNRLLGTEKILISK